MTSNSLLTLERTDLICDANYIDGRWIAADAGDIYDVCNPATEKVFTTVPNSTVKDAEDALNAAQAAFTSWREVSALERSALLKRWHKLIVENLEDLARIMCLEQGKPIAEARAEVSYSADYVELYAEEATRINGEIVPQMYADRRQLLIKEPVGVVAAITPWNFPMAMIARKIGPAIAAGCTVVAKPAEDTPLCSLALIKLLDEAGCPKGVANIISASRENAVGLVKVWLDDPRVRKITFTGSTEVGKYLARESAATLKKLSLELGGNAPFIVFEDADLEAAADGLMSGKFRNGGQTCVCPNRVFVHNDVYEEFSQIMIKRVNALRVGPASIENSEIGPMINQKAVDKVDRHVQDALQKGATLLTGGERVTDKEIGTNFYTPTIISEVNEEMVIFTEETFGPVLPLLRFDNEDEVIKRANDTAYGLASYFYTTDIKRVWRVSGRLEAGSIGINAGATASPFAPVGGTKESGYGREGSHYGIEDYLHIKYMCQGELD